MGSKGALDNEVVTVRRNYARIAEGVGRLALLASGALYVIGFLVFNLHLSRYGFARLDLIDSVYPLAGAWALVPVAYFLIVQHLVERIFALDARHTNVWKGRGLKALKVMLVLVGVALINRTIEMYLGVPIDWRWTAFTYGFPVVWLVTRGLLATKAELEKASGRRLVASVSTLTRLDAMDVPFVLGYLALFASALYPTIPQNLGGGGAIRAVLVPKEPGDDALSRLGLQTLNGRSKPILLLATSPTDMVVLADTTTVIVLRRELVAGVLIQGQYRIPRSIRGMVIQEVMQDTAPMPIVPDSIGRSRE